MSLSLSVCVRFSHLSHRRPPKPSLHRHDPAGWAVNQTHIGAHTHTHIKKIKTALVKQNGYPFQVAASKISPHSIHQNTENTKTNRIICNINSCSIQRQFSITDACVHDVELTPQVNLLHYIHEMLELLKYHFKMNSNVKYVHVFIFHIYKEGLKLFIFYYTVY